LDKGFDVNVRDNVNSTPLHWACYSGAGASVAYLVSADGDTNIKDLDGTTPLHLSVKSTDSTKSTRITKQLLFSGADREIANKEGLRAIDIVDDIEIDHLREELKKALVMPKYCSCCLLS
jgi:ankyrin repeat protein